MVMTKVTSDMRPFTGARHRHSIPTSSRFPFCNRVLVDVLDPPNFPKYAMIVQHRNSSKCYHDPM